MSEILLFHHALGQTPGFLAFGELLREAGHVVHEPDLFEGETFESIEDGVAHASEVGFERVLERGVRAAEDRPDDVVYAGLSLGVMPAQKLAQTRPGARGALFLYACLPVAEFGSWPDGVPVQIHGAAGDPYFAEDGDLEAARALAATVPEAELFVYPGDRHLFAEVDSPWYDDPQARLLRARVLDFLRRLDERDG